MAKITERSKVLSELEKQRSEILIRLAQARREQEHLHGDAVRLVLDGADIGKLPERIHKLEIEDRAIVTAVGILDARIRIARELLAAEEREAAAELEEMKR